MSSWRAAVLALALLPATAVEPDGPWPPPELVVEAPASLAGAAARIERLDRRRLEQPVRLTGLRRPGPPVRVVLAAEDSQLARQAPSWVAGYAWGALGVVVLFPERSPAYPDGSFEEVVLHELAHVLVSRAAGGREVPRWFNEGLAMFAGRSWRLGDRSRLTWALLLDRRLELAAVEEGFAGGRAEAGRAYAFAGAFLNDLIRRHGIDAPGRILAAVALGRPFDDAFRDVTGLPLDRAEASFWRRHSLWYRWLPVLTSSATLWLGITLLALVAIRRRRRRDAEMAARWEAEEAARAEAAGGWSDQSWSDWRGDA